MKLNHFPNFYFNFNLRPYILLGPPGPNCSPKGSCPIARTNLGNPSVTELAFDLSPKHSLSIETWSGGCLLKNLKFEADCFYPGVTCYGQCEGTTKLLCQEYNTLECSVGIEFDIAEIAGKKVAGVIEALGVSASASFELGYKSMSTVFVKFKGAVSFGNMRRRTLLGHDAKVGRCRLKVSNTVLKAPMGPALETIIW